MVRPIAHSLTALALALSATVTTVHTIPAHAFAGDESHCFGKPNKAADSIDPDVSYANGTMEDPEQVEALEELAREAWALRLSTQPFLRQQDVLDNAQPLERQSDYWSTRAAIILQYEQERFERRSGSRIVSVRPEMKRLARQRSQLRSLKQKPCNPHILYLGG